MAEVAAGWRPGGSAPVDVVETRPPDEHEIELAVQAVRLHARREAVYGGYCSECGWAWPCVTRHWGAQLLEAADWDADTIDALDGSSGAGDG